MSVAQRAARGAIWTVASSMGGRAVGVLGTMLMTRFLHPDQIGEVNDAAIVAMSCSWITIWGFGQYAVVKGRGDEAAEVTWHATVAYLVLGTISIGLGALFAGRLAPLLDAPHAVSYIPWMALAVWIKRLSAMPERVLTRQMKFRASGMALAFGEITYTVSALTLAALGWGGMSIVAANIVQSCVVVLILVKAAGIKSWATPTKLKWSRFKDMLKFGVPLGVQGIAHNAARYWDNLTVSHFFGPGSAGAYNMAYNLADIPAIQVGEQIALVLMPSMAELPKERRGPALEKASAMLSLIIFPLAVGLGLVAYPLIGLILPSNEWQEVAPLLTVLACLSVFRPITWTLSAYVEAESKTGRLMFLEVAKVVLIVGGIALLSPFGLRISACAVGIAFALSAVAGVILVAREGPSATKLLIGFLQPLAACGCMGGAIWLVHTALANQAYGLQLPAMIVVGGAVYVAAALVLCRATARELLSLTKRALKR